MICLKGTSAVIHWNCPGLSSEDSDILSSVFDVKYHTLMMLHTYSSKGVSDTCQLLLASCAKDVSSFYIKGGESATKNCAFKYIFPCKLTNVTSNAFFNVSFNTAQMSSAPYLHFFEFLETEDICDPLITLTTLL